VEKQVLLKNLTKIFNREDEQGFIISKTIMSASKFSPDDIETVNKQGLKNIPLFIEDKVKNEELNDVKFLSNLFALEQVDLSQLPISFYAEIVQSQAFKNFGKDKQNDMFSKVFNAIGVEDLTQLGQVEAEKVAYNHKEYKIIFQNFFKVNNIYYQTQVNQLLDNVIDQKLQEMVDKAPALKSDPDKQKAMTELPQRHNGNLQETTEEVLSLFEDTKDLKQKNLKKNLNALGVGNDFEHATTTAKAVLAQYKLGAFAEAAKAKGLITEQQAEKYSIVDQSKKDNSVNKYINTCKNVLANFAKPQNLAKIGFRQIATKAAQHLTEGTIPGIGAAVGLAMKLAECGKKIFKDKQKPAEVFKEAIPDLVRGTVTLGASFSPLAPIAAMAGPIGTVASIATKGIKAAYQEGITLGHHGFVKRVLSEFKTKGNLLNLAMSGLGAAIGGLARNGNDTEVVEESQQELEIENDEVIQTEAVIENEQAQYETEINAKKYEGLEDQHQIDAEGQLEVGTSQTTEEIIEEPLSYAEQYIAEHPGAHFDANGWVQNADGSYAKNEFGQLFGNEQRVFRVMDDSETLDEYGNIIDKESVFDEKDDITETVNSNNDLTVNNDENITEECTEQEVDGLINEDLEQYRTIAKNLDTYIQKADADKELVDIWEQQKSAYEILGNENSSLADREQALAQLDALKNQKEIFVKDKYFGIKSDDAVSEDVTSHETQEVSEVVEGNETQEISNITENSNEQEVKELDEKEIPEQQSEAVEQQPSLTVRSQEELAEIEALQKKVTEIRNFNSLPEKWQKELIEIKAKAVVAQEQGDSDMYNRLHKVYDEKFKDYVAKDKELDALSEKANIRGTMEWRQREHEALMIRSLPSEERISAIQDFEEKYGVDMGDGKNGVRQYIREGGDLKMEVPDVPERNFAELGYQQQADGSWIIKNNYGYKVVNDMNHNGIPDAGDEFKKEIRIPNFASQNSGVLRDPVREQVNPYRNAQTELENAINRERVKLNQQDLGMER